VPTWLIQKGWIYYFIINFSPIYWTCKIQNVTSAAVLVGLQGDHVLCVRINLEEELSLCITNGSG
jgi:hypothetical protein